MADLAFTFRAAFYVCTILSALALSALIFCIGIFPSSANFSDLHIKGAGDLQVRTDTEHAADFASMKGGEAQYDSNIDWGNNETTTFSSSFILASASSDGKWRNAYRVKGSGADHKVTFSATKIEGPVQFGAIIKFDGEAANNKKLDTTFSIDTRLGNATMEGRLINGTTGKPATMQELSLVGKYLVDWQVNISKPEIKPEDWLQFCSDIEKEDNNWLPAVQLVPAT